MIRSAIELGASLPVFPLYPVEGVPRVPGRQEKEKGESGSTTVIPTRVDFTSLSPEALALAAAEEHPDQGSEKESPRSAHETTRGERQPGAQAQQGEPLADAVKPRAADGEALSPEEQKKVSELQARDSEVRAHENAHKAAAGELAAGGPTYEFETGPDGRDYAVGGEVQISLREGRTPEDSIRLAQKARRAALAPAEPSGQDRAVAAEAGQMEARARQEMNKQDATRKSGRSGAPPRAGEVRTSSPPIDPRVAAYGPGTEDEDEPTLGELFA